MSLRTEKVFVSLLLLAILGGGFVAVARWVDGRSVGTPPWLATPLDAHLPLVPLFVWLYLSWYPATTAVLWTDQNTFRGAYAAYALAFAACATGYILLPVEIQRPTVLSHSGVSGAALALLYRVDPPRNLFPSFHAAIATILVRLASKNQLYRLAIPWCVGVCAACVLTKQHYVLDVVAGVAVGITALRVVDFAKVRITSSPMARPEAVGVPAAPE